MALPATGVWEIQSGGDDTNGGMFDPSVASAGTDLTYPASAPIAYSDLVIAATTTNVSSVARAFIAADVGNTINITAGTGFTAGRYNIRSVSGGVATLDRSVGTAASTGGTGRLGGAMATDGATAGAIITAATAGMDVHQKAATYLIGSGTANTAGNRVNLTVAGAGGTNNSIWRGYGTTRGDSGTRPTLKADTGVTGITLFTTTGVWTQVDSLIFDGNSGASNNGLSMTGASSSALRVRAINCPGTGISVTNQPTAISCEAESCGSGIVATAGSVVGSTAKSNTGVGITADTVSCCIAWNNGSHGFASVSSAVGLWANCVSYNNTGSGFNFTPNKDIALGCAAVSNSARGFTLTNTDANKLLSCAGYNNATGNHNALAAENFVALSANPFDATAIAAITDLASAFAAFRPNTVAGGGALLRAAGLIPYGDIGASQHQDSGGMMTHPGMTGGTV